MYSVRRSPLRLLAATLLATFAAIAACSSDEATTEPASDASTGADTATADGDPPTPADASTDDAPTEAATDADAAPCDGSTNACVVSVRYACSAGALASEACGLGCAGTGCNTSCDSASTVIDQSVSDDFVIIPPWQTFELAATGVLTALEVRANIYSATNTPSELTLSVYVGDGTKGTRIAQQSFTVPAASGAPFTMLALATPAPVQAGQTYTWELLGAKGIHYAMTDVYPNGHASVPTRDLTFKAHAQACH